MSTEEAAIRSSLGGLSWKNVSHANAEGKGIQSKWVAAAPDLRGGSVLAEVVAEVPGRIRTGVAVVTVGPDQGLEKNDVNATGTQGDPRGIVVPPDQFLQTMIETERGIVDGIVIDLLKDRGIGLVIVRENGTETETRDRQIRNRQKERTIKEAILSASRKTLISRLQFYQCQQFRLLPDVLVCRQQFKRGNGNRLYNGNSKADYNPGNYKEDQRDYFGDPPNHTSGNFPRLRRKRRVKNSIENDAARLDNIVQNFPRELVAHTFAFLGHRVQISCNSNLSNRYQGAIFNWAHNNGVPVYAPAVTVNTYTGELTIPVVQLSDTDTYQCQELLPNGKNISTSHRLSVVTDSIHWLSITSYYESQGCHTKEMEDIQNNLKSWIGNYVCPICTMHGSSVICDAGSTGSPQYVIHFALTAFNFENEIDTRLDLGFCSEICLQAIHLLLLRIVANSVRKLFARPIQGSDGKTFYPQPDTVHIELMTGCLSGFSFNSTICFPCTPGHYSERGESDCLECDHGSYQAAMAASRCIPCKKDEDTVDDGATDPFACLPLNLVNAYNAVEDNKSSALAATVVLVVLFLCIILCSKNIEKSQVPANIGRRYIKETPQQTESNDLIKIKETGDSEFRAIQSRTPKNSWKKIVKAKVPHMWAGSQHTSNYSRLAELASSSSSESELQNNKYMIRDGKSKPTHTPSENQITSHKHSRKSFHVNDRSLSLKHDMYNQKKYSSTKRGHSRIDSKNAQAYSKVSRNPTVEPGIQVLSESYTVSGNPIDNENQNSPNPSMVNRNSPIDYEFQRNPYPSVVSRSAATGSEVQNTLNDSSASRYPIIDSGIQKTRHHSYENDRSSISGTYEIRNSQEQSIIGESSNIHYEIQNSPNHSPGNRNYAFNYDNHNSRNHSVVSRNPTIDYENLNSPNHSVVSRSLTNDYEIQNSPNHSVASRKPTIDYEIQNSQNHSKVNRNSTIEYTIQNSRKNSVVSRKPTIDHKIRNSQNHSVISRKPTIDHKIPNSRNHSMISRNPTIGHEIPNSSNHPTMSRNPTINYEVDTRKNSGLSKNPPDYEIQNSLNNSMAKRSPTTDYENQSIGRQSFVDRNPTVDWEIQNTRKNSTGSRKISSLCNSEIQNSRKNSAESGKNNPFLNSEIQNRKHFFEESRHGTKHGNKSVFAVHRNSHFDDSGAASRLPSSNVGVQTHLEKSTSGGRYPTDQSRSNNRQGGVDSCERCYERIQKRILEDLAAPKKKSAVDDEALSKVRVRETIEKINAVSNFSKPKPTVYDMHSHHKNRQGCSNDMSTKGNADITSGDWSQQQPLDSRWDHNCHRCIKPSLRQPRLLPPAPPE
ncbi:unnamed protein product [Allacma fusca]|uniref:Ig-like domain-containing protein n=1 Tax=Allacma fusca TaxID=39272 RepID=A0A8J2K795_9HEXA|nr:unnamed protein product [Allacma fusca]